MKIKARITALLLVAIFTVSIVPSVSLAAGAQDVRIVSTAGALFGAFGQYVIYEMDGKTYNTKDGNIKKNTEAWDRMTNEQKKVVYNSLHTSAAKKTAFGSSGVGMLADWNKKSDSYYKANKEWQLRIAKRDYPELTEKFGEGATLANLYSEYNEIANYPIPTDAAWWHEAQAFRDAVAAVEKEYQIGREYYEKTIEMRTKGIAGVVTITVTQCTIMLSDMLFVPSVAKGAANEASSHIADILSFLKDFVMAEGSDFSAKFLRYQNGETGIAFTPAETVKLYGALMNSYAKMTEKSIEKIDAAMLNLISRHRTLTASYDYYQADIARRQQDKILSQQSYYNALDDKYLDPEITVSGQYEGLNFRWFTEEQLFAKYNHYEDHVAVQNAVWYDVMNKKRELDLEAGNSAEILFDNIVYSYNAILECIGDKESELTQLNNLANSPPPEGISSYLIAEWNEDGYVDFTFTGLDVFSEVMGIRPDAVSVRKMLWPVVLQNLSAGIAKTRTVRNGALSFVNSMDNLAASIKPHLEDLASNLEQMRQLIDDYDSLYGSVVWEFEGKFHGIFTNPWQTEDYPINMVRNICNDLKEPEYDKLYSDLMYNNTEVLDKLSTTLPLALFQNGYSFYEAITNGLEFYATRKESVQGHYDNFLSDEAAYYDELNKRLAAYVEVKNKMSEKFDKINQAATGFMNLWEGAYFKGYDDYYNSSDSYNFNGYSRPFSAFKAGQMRTYLRGGGSRFVLLTKLRDLADYAAAYEAVTTDLLAQIDMLDVEMDAIVDNTLRGYAEAKGVEYKNTYSFRDDYPNINWLKMNNGTFFDLYDIDSIMAAVSGDSEIFEEMSGYKAELLGYLNAPSVNKVAVSNRMYSIYTRAKRVYEVYSGSYYNSTFLTSEQCSDLLKLYRNTGTGDIEGTLYDITSKHQDTSFSPYSLPTNNGTDYYNPKGDFDTPTLAEDRVKITAPLYYPMASGVTLAEVKVFQYGSNGWEPLSNSSQGQPMMALYRAADASDDFEIVIDSESSTMTIYARGLKNNQMYMFDWDITYTLDGGSSTDREKDDIIMTVTYPPAIAATAVLDENCFSAVATVTNLTEDTISGKYVYIDGFKENGELIATVGSSVSTLEPMEIEEITLTFDQPVYRVSARIENEHISAPSKLVMKKDGEKATNITAVLPATLAYTADVFDQLGSLLPSESVTWMVSPAGAGVSISSGEVTIGENAAIGEYTISAIAEGTVEDNIILTVEDSNHKNSITYNGLIKKGATISGGLALKIANSNPNIESCDFLVGIYEKDKNVLAGLAKITLPVDSEVNEISIDDLNFYINPAKTYEVRIFNWLTVNGLKPIANVLKTDI